MNNLLSYCGLVDARISASEKDYTCNSMRKFILLRIHENSAEMFMHMHSNGSSKRLGPNCGFIMTK
jgi:hypothetical protein